MNYWLMKTEPDTYSWTNLQDAGKATWDGVRNFRARSNMKAMAKGDLVFIYHTGDEKAVIGIAKVEKGAYPDPGDKDWVVVDIKPKKQLKKTVSLAQVKADRELKEMVLAKVARLSVQPVKKTEFDRIIKLSEEK